MAERRPDLAREHRLHDSFRGPPRASPVRFSRCRGRPIERREAGREGCLWPNAASQLGRPPDGSGGERTVKASAPLKTAARRPCVVVVVVVVWWQQLRITSGRLPRIWGITPPLCLVPASATGNRLVRRHARVACFYQVMRNRPKIGRCLLCQCEPASPRCSSTRERTAVPFAHAASDCACLGCLGWRCLGRLGCPATALRPPPPRLAAPDLGARAARGTLGRALRLLLLLRG